MGLFRDLFGPPGDERRECRDCDDCDSADLEVEEVTVHRTVSHARRTHKYPLAVMLLASGDAPDPTDDDDDEDSESEEDDTN